MKRERKEKHTVKGHVVDSKSDHKKMARHHAAVAKHHADMAEHHHKKAGGHEKKRAMKKMDKSYGTSGF
jgi:hypothetical protein